MSPEPLASLNLGNRVGDDPANVAENERRVLSALGIGAPARAQLVHGIATRIVETGGLYDATDALVTGRPDLVLALTVADCYPLAIVSGRWKALAHCGWRGVAGGIVEEVLRVLRGCGTEVAGARAWIGPGIGSCCYEVGPEVAAHFGPDSLRAPGGPAPAGNAERRKHLDLAGDISRRLVHAGLLPGSILRSGLCTSCHTERFFSHRAEGRTGRMSAYLQ